ncbi:MAG: DUF2304 domain-containing protein [Atopobiaceae bacterium]|nr:DUF2304 domain-containing protein [Atopobiaceae bacterium]MBQ6523876.1 DUF2304 domain-containing protein [Atopobiaceae bacterium]
MSLTLRLFILAGAVLIIATVLRYIQKKRILMSDATSWVCIAVLLLLIALFPRIVTWTSGLLGFESPANFVFFVVTGLLVVKTFRDSAKMSLLRHKLEELAQEVALASGDRQDTDSREANNPR